LSSSLKPPDRKLRFTSQPKTDTIPQRVRPSVTLQYRKSTFRHPDGHFQRGRSEHHLAVYCALTQLASQSYGFPPKRTAELPFVHSLRNSIAGQDERGPNDCSRGNHQLLEIVHQ
jgi:hypothetical protein